MSPSFSGALEASFGQAAPEEPGEEPVPGEGPPADVTGLLAEAQEHFAAAEAALREGDLATYQSEIEEAQRLIQDAAELAGVAPSPEPEASPGG